MSWRSLPGTSPVPIKIEHTGNTLEKNKVLHLASNGIPVSKAKKMPKLK
jgi:hypothetical protein